jgi:hypothetical protein
MIETPDNQPSAPTSEELLTSAFERLPTAKKMELMWEFLYLLNQDFGKLNDPVLSRETDFVDGVFCNIDTRLEEIKAIYGQQG